MVTGIKFTYIFKERWGIHPDLEHFLPIRIIILTIGEF